MILHQVKPGEEEKIFPLLDERIEEANLGSRIDPPFVKILMSRNLEAGTIDVFTDDPANPQCLLIVSYGRLTLLTEEAAIINILHVSKDLRKKNPVASLELGRVMVKLAEAKARYRKCHSLRGTSLVWRGGIDISSFFTACDFELQSHEYVKLLTTERQ